VLQDSSKNIAISGQGLKRDGYSKWRTMKKSEPSRKLQTFVNEFINLSVKQK